MNDIVLAGRPVADAADRLHRYAGLPWSGGEPEVWAFAYYDAVPTAHDSIVTPTDVLCAASLHPGLRRADLEFFARRGDDLSAWLHRVPTDLQLWMADDGLLAHLDALVGFEPDVPLTLLTKVLHRKRPHFIPLLDRHVIDWYRRSGDPRRVDEAWPLVTRRMRDDLLHPGQRDALASYCSSVSTFESETVSMIRFIDIAIWMESR